MGSIFTTIPGNTIKGFGGRLRPIPFYIQFVPGNVVEVVHSEESLRYNGERSINTIIAIPHVTDKSYETKNTTNEKNRYYPLLRGIQDVPSKGDPVLLCTIGKTNYFLGPINTPNNSPTWNDDPSYKAEAILTNTDQTKVGRRGAKGQSLNFNNLVKYKRLTKKRVEELDFGSAVFETTGDMLLEGRHGNSMRIGSRNKDPYVFISNKRNTTNFGESLSDGTLISITSNGTLQQHFGTVTKTTAGATEQEKLLSLEIGEEKIFGFQLASDSLESANRTMGQMISNVNNNQDSQELIYNFSGNQALINSDRITLNTKSDDIYLSSVKDIHIGTGRNVTISANESLIIDSQNIVLGNVENTTQPMVLGDELKDLLNQIIELFSKIQVMTQFGPQNILPNTQPDIQSITNKIEQIASTKYKIESN